MEKLLNTFKVLSDETRVRLLVMLYHKKLCVCELCGVLGESQPKVSKHLAKLRDMGFVKDERQEQFIFYYLNMNNKILNTILKEIVDNLEEYPTLSKDLQQLEDVEKFIQVCEAK
ncbi:MAG TPA: metalloregulator ArsR/SmtB family transcription factor [Patescibacteria group bacterium]|nr:metalloregulator ArsR/SmtB family transcription factor [Patescibacteria group bacterium]